MSVTDMTVNILTCLHVCDRIDLLCMSVTVLTDSSVSDCDHTDLFAWLE